MEPRPRITPALSELDRVLELTSKILLLALWCLTGYVLFTSPSTIPVHFNVAGRPDSYGNRLTLLILPIFATGIYFGLTQLNKYPHIFNYLTRITPDNAGRQYTIATRMMRWIKLAMLLLFLLITLFSYLTAIEVTDGLGSWFLPLTLGLLLLPTCFLIFQSLRDGKR